MYTPFLANTTNFPFGIEVDRAEGVFIFDKSGKKYFDLIAGLAVSNLGHQHPYVIDQIKKQINKHLHVMVFGEYSQSIQNRLDSGMLDESKIEYGFIKKDNRGETVNVSFTFRNGSVDDLMNKGSVAGYTARMLNKGTESKSRQEIMFYLF